MHWSTKALAAVVATGVVLYGVNEYLAKRAALESRERRRQRKKDDKIAKTG